MKKMWRIMLSVGLIFTLLFQSVLAVEGNAQPTPVVDRPSAWSIWDVQMLSIYGIGNSDSYSNYADYITAEDLLVIESSFEKKFNVVDETKLGEESPVVKATVIEELYDIIVPALSLEESTMTPVKYFKENHIIVGDKNNKYGLADQCTKEELLVLAKRVYDHLCYELDLSSKGAFWKVSDKDNTVYLLGSIHYTDGTVYPMNQEILKSFVSADNLVVEANILKKDPEDAAYTQKIMMLEGDTTLDQLISKENYDAFVDVIKPLGLQPELYNKFKPWYAAMLVSNIQLVSGDYKPGLGIDAYFLALANNWKPIIELEGLRYQLDMFDSFSPELQESYLQGILAGEEINSEVMDTILTHWKSGDMVRLERAIFKSSSSKDNDEFTKKMYEVRNAHMVESVEAMLNEKASQDYFVVVGVGHMLNDDGIVKVLRSKGYKVEQVK